MRNNIFINNVQTGSNNVIFTEQLNERLLIQLFNRSIDTVRIPSIRIKDSYGVKDKYLDKNFIEITPEVGELIIFNPMRIHSVEEIRKGSRLSWSCFIGLEAYDKPLQIWS